MRTTVLAAIGILVAAAMLYRDAQQSARVDRLMLQVASQSSQPQPPAAPTLIAPRVGSPEVDVDALAARLSERLKPVAGVEKRQEPAASLPTHEQAATLDDANHIVETAISRGRMSRDDTRRLQSALMAANRPAEAEELFRQLSVAINTDRVVVEGSLLAREP